MHSEARLIRENIELLEQGRNLLDSIADPNYCHISKPLSSSAIGGHIRHCLDFYQSFLTGIETGRIDYDHRERDELIQSDRRAAMAKIETTIKKLNDLNLSSCNTRLLINLEGGLESGDPACWSWSSIRRELQSLLSHTIHHYALIAMLVRLQGCTVPMEFGVAPSTLMQWRKTS